MSLNSQFLMTETPWFRQAVQSAVVTAAVAVQGEALRENIGTLTNISAANPAVVTHTAHGYANGNRVLLDEITDAEFLFLNNNIYELSGVLTNSYELVGVDTTGLTWSGTGQAGNNAKTTLQTNKRQAYAALLLEQHAYENGVPVWLDTWVHAVAANGTIASAVLKVLALGTATTQARPPVVTSTAHGLANGAVGWFEFVAGMTELNYVEAQNNLYEVGNVAADTFELVGIDAQGFGLHTANTGYFKTYSGQTNIDATGEVQFVVNGLFDDMAGVTTTDLAI